MSARATAFGIRQPRLDLEWRAFLRDAKPWSVILFREACVARAQVQALCAEIRAATGQPTVISIDQEGGRVARLKAPEWPAFPAPAAYARLYAKDPDAGLEACFLGHRLIGHALRSLGVDGNYAPVLDLPVPGSDPIIGDRAFGDTPETISALAAQALAGLHAGGVLSCIKHMPGHGRADVDSHLSLPRVSAGLNELGQDFAPFRALANAPMAMTAHVVYTALDPEVPATWSPKVIGLIRDSIGFAGLLASDDLDMKALSGSLRSRTERAIAAGCDLVLQCTGVVADMAEVAEGAPVLAGKALARAEAAQAICDKPPEPFDPYAAEWRWRDLLAQVP